MLKRVLVAEDNGDISRLVRDVLEDEGYTVSETHGPETVAEVRAYQPDVMLLDYQMPGMDGIAIAQEIRADPSIAHTCIVAMTAVGSVSIVGQAMDANGVLGKPFDIDDLISVVDGLFARRTNASGDACVI